MTSPADCIIQPNPDIIGIGIRLSIYFPSLAGPLLGLITTSSELLDSIEASLGLTGLALLFTSIISAVQQTLDLFHALCLFHLVGLAGISINPNGRGSMKSTRRNISVALFYTGFLIYLIFMIYLISNAKTFGSTPDCNSNVKFVLFGISVPATTSVFRWIFLITLGGGVLGTIVRFLLTHFLDPEHQIWAPTGESALVGINPFKVFGNMLGRIYVITMLEAVLRRNDLGPGMGAWTFGQVLAMMMLIGPLVEVISALRKKADGGDEDEGYEALFNNWLGWQSMYGFAIFAAISVLDLAWNALAGVLAAKTGAHVNGSASTKEVLRLGALAGVIKSGILNFSLLVSRATGDIVSQTLVFGLSTFGLAFIVTVAIAQEALDEVPDALMIAALATGAPLLAGNVIQESAVTQTSFPFFLISIGFDALSGYTFARVAQNHGYELCKPKAAAAAGAVFGVAIGLIKLNVHTCVKGMVEASLPKRSRSNRNRRAQNTRGNEGESLQLLQR